MTQLGVYNVTAKLVDRTKEIAAIDFGIRAVGGSDSLTDQIHAGDFAEGSIQLTIDRTIPSPSGFERLLPLYSWRIDRIHADLTPFLPHPDHPRVLIPDRSHPQYREVNTTRYNELRCPSNAARGFVFGCTLLDISN
jgi:hypothetical protein